MVGISRSEGYVRARGKEEEALSLVQDFFTDVLELPTELITGEERNRTHGDLEVGRGSAECKSQPIDPERYRQNFVEVMEDTTALRKPWHADGFAKTAELLSLTEAEFASSSYRDCRVGDQIRTLGTLAFVSCSLTSIAGSKLTLYANPDPDHTFVYVYRRAFLLRSIRRAVMRGGMWRAKGRSNDDTFGVFVPVSPARWTRAEGRWTYIGPSTAPIATVKAIILESVGAGHCDLPTG